MKRMVLLFTVAAVMAAVMAVSALPAFASHPHYLSTPGTCVENIASGQTAKVEGEGGHHKFHENVHLGTPGTEAFASEANPLSVGKGSCP